jgi:hypothetical protein
MDRFVRAAVICGAIGAALVIAPAARAQSFGCLRMPSTVAQYLGYGYGAGHHAPIVRTPGVRPERVQRMAISPQACGPLGPAPYEMVGCYGDACQGGCAYGGGPYLGAPAGMQPAAPMMVPDPADQYAPQMQGPGPMRGPAVGPMMQAPMAMRPAAGYPMAGYVMR